MKKQKMDKGITLIALLITIVLLLILAVVAINSITEGGILIETESSADKYNQSVKDEQGTLGKYEEFFNDYIGGSTTVTWTQSGTSVTNGSETLSVGQTVSGYEGYSGSYTGGWAVLGAEKGKLLLVSKVNVQSSLSLNGKTGYNNGITNLNTACATYLNSTLADEARSIKVEDINRVTGYNPETAEYGKGNPYQYGNTVTYTMNSEGKVVYTSKVATGSNASGTSTNTKFEHVDGRTLTTSNPIDVESNYYYYTGSTYLTDTTSDAYKVLFKKANGTDNDSYWLASEYQSAGTGIASFGLRGVNGGDLYYNRLWGSGGGANSGSDGVRAVVSLKSGVNITSAGVIS